MLQIYKDLYVQILNTEKIGFHIERYSVHWIIDAVNIWSYGEEFLQLKLEIIDIKQFVRCEVLASHA